VRIKRSLFLACAAAAALWAPAVAVVHLCAWMGAGGALSLELEGGCHETHGTPKTRHTPLGSGTSTFYTARWGVTNLQLLPEHVVSVGVAHVTGSSAVLALVKKEERAKVLENGVLVANSNGVLATEAGDTYSCQNPPTGDCTKTEFESVKGNWGVVLGVVGAPPGSPGAQEENSGEDDPQDLAQEESLKGPTVGLGLAITARL